ncbi:MAG: putative metal-dependent HD superfamily phosphohydrolase [Paraglaciecola sp.]|jgi:predicted metal-dependent HD superfamily phosphohydrolase
MKAPITKAAEAYVVNLLENGLTDDHLYHDLQHTLMVAKATRLLSSEMDLPEEEREVLELAGLFHDTGFVETYTGHEEVSKCIAQEFLQKQSYPTEKIQLILHCIDATLMGYDPKTLLQKILKDADFNNLRGQSYKKKAAALRHEWLVFFDEKYTNKKWLKTNIEFWSDHQFYTPGGELLFGTAKDKNLEKLQKQMKEETKKKDKKKKEKKREVQESNGILATKSSQMMFKTTLRNHIDLTSIADNKANIMLTINALIITVAMPLLASKIDGNKYMLVPIAVLLLTCTFSIIFATLATRPVPTGGKTNIDNVGKSVTNLFFYGNFWQMPLDKYKIGIEKVATNDAILDDTVVNDLYFLGRALGHKFRRLRICYSIFMVGMTLTVISFIVSYLFMV